MALSESLGDVDAELGHEHRLELGHRRQGHRTIVLAENRALGSGGLWVQILLLQLLSHVLEVWSREGGRKWAKRRCNNGPGRGKSLKAVEEESGAFRKGGRKLGAGGRPGAWEARLSGQGPMGHVKDFVLFPEVVRSH